MTVLPFTHPRSVYPSRDLGSCAEVRVQSGGAGASIIHPERPARISIRCGSRIGLYRLDIDRMARMRLPAFTLTARHPRSIVVVGANQNSAGKIGAYSCSHLTGIFPEGATTGISEFVRALVPGNLSALLHLRQKPSSGFTECFKVLLSVLRHENHHGRRNGQGVVKA